MISTLGGRSPTKTATSVYWRSAEAIAEAAWETGLRRVAVTSSALLFPARGPVDRALTVLARTVVRDARRMEDRLCRADLDLVVGRCGFLTNRDERAYRRALGALPEGGASVARLGLARFLIDARRGADLWRVRSGIARARAGTESGGRVRRRRSAARDRVVSCDQASCRFDALSRPSRPDSTSKVTF
ncbi:NAD(P)H-binding [Jannaschia seohaensis]|uniref:NAD(P)H-binding n=1 Tax=Jannaschia seohaensis TaxID=475081 RepID=A0A2Y9B2Q6_9RHOB|nr:putative NAD(P)-binding protein [Jannaschia seohaensis]SSA50746.1 NAD(P)H-binding [Jannaschia seohaensis]